MKCRHMQRVVWLSAQSLRVCRKMAVLQMKFSLDGNTRFWKKITLFIKSGRIMDMRDGLRQKSMCPWKV